MVIVYPIEIPEKECFEFLVIVISFPFSYVAKRCSSKEEAEEYKLIIEKNYEKINQIYEILDSVACDYEDQISQISEILDSIKDSNRKQNKRQRLS